MERYVKVGYYRGKKKIRIQHEKYMHASRLTLHVQGVQPRRQKCSRVRGGSSRCGASNWSPHFDSQSQDISATSGIEHGYIRVLTVYFCQLIPKMSSFSEFTP